MKKDDEEAFSLNGCIHSVYVYMRIVILWKQDGWYETILHQNFKLFLHNLNLITRKYLLMFISYSHSNGWYYEALSEPIIDGDSLC